MSGSQFFDVTGLSCQSCVNHVTAALAALPGVRAVRVDLRAGSASRVDVDADRILSDAEVAGALADEGDYVIVR